MSLTKITSEGIADGSIVNADLHSAANIDGTKIADNSIGGGKIPANQITNAHLATSTILRGNLSNNCIGTTEIIDTAVTLAKLEHGTSSNDGKFLRANNGADPTFETVDTTTNLGISTATDSVTVTSSTGNNAQISEASGSAAGVMSVAHHDKLDGIEASATADQTASEILTLIKTVDGAGSGLDADTLDGISSASFVRSDASDTLTGAGYTFSTSENEKIVLSGSSDPYIRWQEGTTNRAYIQFNSNNYFYFANQQYNTNLKLGDTFTFYDGSSDRTVYHTGNLPTSIANLLEDTTPQLGGDLDTNSFEISLDDNHAVKFGNSADLTVKHDGSNAFLQCNTGSLNLSPSGDAGIQVNQSGSVKLAHNDSFKLETASGGISVTGNISVSGTVDGRDVASDGSKLDGIASGANNITNNNQISNGAGYMSGSTSQLVKAYVNYNENNNSIRDDYNVSSITDHANGDQTVNFSSSISMSYTVSGMPIGHDHLGARCTNCIRGSSSSGPTRMNSTGVRIMRGFGSHNARQDGHTMCVAIHRP